MKWEHIYIKKISKKGVIVHKKVANPHVEYKKKTI